MRSAAERPSCVSEARRKAKRRASAVAGRWMLRSNSPGRRTFVWLPVTKSSTAISRGAAAARPQRAGTLKRRGERDHRPRGQRHADVAADGRRVPDLERGEKRVAALARAAASALHAAGPQSDRARRSCRSRRSPVRRPRPRARASPASRGRSGCRARAAARRTARFRRQARHSRRATGDLVRRGRPLHGLDGGEVHGAALTADRRARWRRAPG